MTIENMKATNFNNASLEDWQEKALASLKGKPIDTLYTSTYEQITLKPLYTQEDIMEDQIPHIPGKRDFRRGNYPLGYRSTPWQIANPLAYTNLEELEEKISAALAKGQTALSFEVRPELFADSNKLVSFFEKFKSDYPFSVDAAYLQAPLLAALIHANNEAGTNMNITGFVAADPVAEASLSGALPKEEEQFFSEWSRNLEEANIHLPGLKTVLVNTSPYHNSGANAVQELAIAISTGVYLLEKLMNHGWELKKALTKMVFHFAIGSNFFMETAKLRAARLLWSKTLEAYGAGEQERKMEISAETSLFTKTIFDPYVNMLRIGNEAFAAVLGGVQYLRTGTFDEALGNGDTFSERVARNTQLILKSEAHLEKVADPAGGSWYIESLTRQLAEKAWDLFLEIDRKGGMLEALKTGWLQEQIAETAKEREKDIFKRKKSIIGTNVYANLSEHFSEPADFEIERVCIDKSLADFIAMFSAGEPLSGGIVPLKNAINFTPIIPKRLSGPYEKLRFKAEKLTNETGEKPSIGLICLGELKKHKARADFIAGLLAAGGLHSVRSSELKDSAAAVDFINSKNISQYVICGDGSDYALLGPELVSEMKKQHPEAKLYLAGLPDGNEADWKEAGIEDFIHLRNDAYQILSSLLRDMEVSSHAKA
ncbi:methylmalonyl-CoA mutase family protein [Bacillus sp. JJ1609]|uniref:methylmalonyl-CoA mutase family protein n=1 Tax=Bacillus sp. JJ1609 TaxID=3122977 RepID=UPI002FFE5A1F